MSSNVRTLLEHSFQHHFSSGVRTFQHQVSAGVGTPPFQHQSLGRCWNAVSAFLPRATPTAYSALLSSSPDRLRRVVVPAPILPRLSWCWGMVCSNTQLLSRCWSVLCPPSTYCTHSVCISCNELIYDAPLSPRLGGSYLRASSESDRDRTSFPIFEA